MKVRKKRIEPIGRSFIENKILTISKIYINRRFLFGRQESSLYRRPAPGPAHNGREASMHKETDQADAQKIARADAERGLAAYGRGRTAVFAHRKDPRFSWLLYVPPDAAAGGPLDLLVSVHGTFRNASDYRDLFLDFGRWNHCMILAPLFPIGVLGDDNRDGYKYLREGDIRYDRILLDMVDEVAQRYAVDASRFGLFGFSGGGQFVNRFLFLHPQRLWAASIGSPGSVTLLDEDREWWTGCKNMEATFESKPDLAALRETPIQLVVGGADQETWGVTHYPGGRYWQPDANVAGGNRPERLRSLQDSMCRQGLKPRFDVVPGIAHAVAGVMEPVKTFMAQALGEYRHSKGDRSPTSERPGTSGSMQHNPVAGSRTA
jgi:poly(3-hydroxybutyrate) depolymerase